VQTLAARHFGDSSWAAHSAATIDRVAPRRSPYRHLKCNDPYPKFFRASSGTSKKSSARSSVRQDRMERESVRRSRVRQNSRCRLAPRFSWTWFPVARHRLCLGRHYVHLARSTSHDEKRGDSRNNFAALAVALASLAVASVARVIDSVLPGCQHEFTRAKTGPAYR
jgi:hypothetical protein